MVTVAKPLVALTAADLMSQDVVVIPHHMSLRAAARMLSQADVTGAPVVDATGSCIGVISAVDFLHNAQNERKPIAKGRRQGDCVCADWQMVEVEQVSIEEVSAIMTSDPVTVAPSLLLPELAKIMIDAHIHRVVVVDGKKRPIGIVSTTDIIAAVAAAD